MRAGSKFLVGAVAGALLIVAGMWAKDEYERSPRLKNRCFVIDGDKLQFFDALHVATRDGGEEYVYLVVVDRGQVLTPITLDVRIANRGIPREVAAGRATEVSCENGELVKR